MIKNLGLRVPKGDCCDFDSMYMCWTESAAQDQVRMVADRTLDFFKTIIAFARHR